MRSIAGGDLWCFTDLIAYSSSYWLSVSKIIREYGWSVYLRELGSRRSARVERKRAFRVIRGIDSEYSMNRVRAITHRERGRERKYWMYKRDLLWWQGKFWVRRVIRVSREIRVNTVFRSMTVVRVVRGIWMNRILGWFRWFGVFDETESGGGGEGRRRY